MESLRISWSSLRNHLDCTMRSSLLREGKRAKSQDVRNFLPGNITDRVVRNYIQAGQIVKDGLKAMVADQLDASIEESKERGGYIKWRDNEATDRARILEECEEAAEKIQPYVDKYVMPYEAWADFSFKAPMMAAGDNGEPIPVTLNGFMDILVRDHKGRFFIFDVKHTRNDQYYKKTGPQLAFYAVAIELIFGVAPTSAALMQPLCKEELKPIPISGSAKATLLRDITRMANDVRKNVAVLTDDTNTCTFCDVKHACPRYGGGGEPDSRGQRRVKLGLPKPRPTDTLGA